MSIKAINEAFKSNLSGNIKLVLLSLADSADESMQCFPSYSHIAKKASISISTAKRIIKKLEEMEVLKKQNRFIKGKKQQTSNIYTLTIASSNLALTKKAKNDTTIVSTMTPQDSVIVMTYESSSSLTTTKPSGESEKDFFNFKNQIVKNFNNKIFAAISEKHIYSICDGLLCINYQKLDKQKAFQEWEYLFINQHLINGKLAENINYLNVGKTLEIGNSCYKILDIHMNDFYVIDLEGMKKCVKITDVTRIVNA
ncbi:helix-turn-helix domain-containing protein [Aliarcobacter cryaerophilus]|uniref:helix-turn-helix domain-containing protein n=1 Tax=Aliarcobacter cryaerophilus TaxID=28198 RepID=UPI0021B40243|nr:helix-turn-helix domain-containing protein [Aliarcobacter cryaerophilus]MCT7512672.1 helix-turn-helix domain-containing protein [Aliarcobacter cryaerophilus]